VDCYIVTDRTEGAVVANVRRKASDADAMAEAMRIHMKEITQGKIGSVSGFAQKYEATKQITIPDWLKG
jgi:hypothetical protein